MKFKKRKYTTHKKPLYSAAYIAERRAEAERLIARESTEAGREAIRKALDVSIRPY